MTKTEQNAPAVYDGIAAITAELAKIGIAKMNRNQQQGYRFRGIDDIYNTLSTLLASNKIVIIPRVIAREQKERTTKKGDNLFFTVVTVEYSIVSAVDGSSFTAQIVGEAMDLADKSTNKAMSAAYKYLCLQLFCIPTEGDNDADATTPPPSTAKERLDHTSPRWVNCLEALRTNKVTAGTVFATFDVPEDDRHYIIEAEKQGQHPTAAPSVTAAANQ